MGEAFQIKVITSHRTYYGMQPGSQVVFQKGVMDVGRDIGLLIEKV